ncbi:MAG: DUF4143 domain-containing protein [Micrococcales bacterium]|nr:DUF4143 domain-containing protein [Micrococcales bacterium]
MDTYRPRLADGRLAELFEDLPAVSVVGPRACGKTTTASRLVSNVVRLDQESVAQAFREDPDVALRAVGEPVVLDEWQFAPQVLGAVKRAVDTGAGTGRFLLTGSVAARFLPNQWPGTGRVTELAMAPMTVRETERAVTGVSFVDRLLLADPGALPPAGSFHEAPDIADYLELALRSGFPEAVASPARSRDAWLSSYVEHVVNRDSQLSSSLTTGSTSLTGPTVLPGRGVDPSKLGRYLEALSLHSSCVVSDQTLLELAGIKRATAATYENLLESLYLVRKVPAWATSQVKRLVRTPKRLVADAGLMAAVLHADAATILLDPELKGRVIETFVAAQLAAELPFSQSRARLYHLRDANGRREVDLLLEYPGGRVAAIEVKATSTVTSADAKHLCWLRDELGDRFVAGVVLYTGAITREIDARVFAAPISTCWATV